MIGFSEGYLVVVSSSGGVEELGEEISCGRFHKGDELVDIANCNLLQRAATCGANGSIKVVDMTNWKPLKEETTKISSEFGKITKMDWTKDGQILTVATDAGVVLNFLARMPTVHDACDTRVAFLSSLREICVEDAVNDAPVQTFPLQMEPSFVGLGPSHVAVGMNIKIWFYRCQAGGRKSKPEVVAERDFPGNIEAIELNSEYAAVLCEGRIHLQLIESNARQYGDQHAEIFFQRVKVVLHI